MIETAKTVNLLSEDEYIRILKGIDEQDLKRQVKAHMIVQELKKDKALMKKISDTKFLKQDADSTKS